MNTSPQKKQNSKEKHDWIWECYLYIFILFLIKKVYLFLNIHSKENLYFSFVNAFDKIFLIHYYCNVSQILLNIIACGMMALWIYKKKFLSPTVWQSVLFLKVIFDVFGHGYEHHYLFSLYYSSPKIFGIVLLQSVFFYLPLYIACYRYAFTKETAIC